jgi:hypothetical protein
VKSVHKVHDVLRHVDRALLRFEPERAEHGDLEGLTKRLWHPDAALSQAKTALDAIEAATLDDESVHSEPAALEELIEFAPLSEIDLVTGLGGKAGIDGKLRSRLLSAGVDGLGWYVSFHQIGVQWGIYIPVSGLVLTALGTFGSLSCDLETKITLAFRLIHQHEMFHFGADYAMAQLEILSAKPVWVPAREKLRDKDLGYRRHEEQLANAWMMRSLRRGKASLQHPL